jgi:hypothetical protein
LQAGVAAQATAPTVAMKSTLNFLLLLIALLVPAAAAAQVTTTNPLDDMKARVSQLLHEAGVPLSDEQNRQLVLVMEDQRRVSERLLGAMMDFSGGPVRGADRDRALAGVQWMNEAFASTLEGILTPEQNRIWSEYRAAEVRASGGLPALRLALLNMSAPLDDAQEDQAAATYDRAAARLREPRANDAAARAAIEDEALAEIATLLTGAQTNALLSPAVDAPANGGSTTSHGPSAGVSAGPRDRLIAVLRRLARPSAAVVSTSASSETRASDQIAQIRINTNPFTTENFGGRGAPGFTSNAGSGSGGGSIEVIERGGVGDYHGNFSFDFRDDALTARNALAGNKPKFQQRNINANISGPFIRNLLTASLTFNQNEQENASTVVAELPSGVLSLGVVSPEVSRQYNANGQMQINPRHALHFRVGHGGRNSRNSGVGGFTLPERAFVSTNSNTSVGLREIWAISSRTMHETVLSYSATDSATDSVTKAVAVDVLDAFRSGGAGRQQSRQSRSTSFSNLFWYQGDRLTFKAGTQIEFWRFSSVTEDGFLGQFTFSSLGDYLAGRPLTYSVTRGDPYLAVHQTELGAFVQTDWHVNRRLTLFGGLRYWWQTNVDDFDDLDPRMGFAYAPGASTVVRGGAGVFHQKVFLTLIEEVARMNGARQYAVVVSNPSYPDPFVSGTAQIVPPSSRRVLAPDLQVPADVRASLSIERTLPWNISVDAAYEFERGRHQMRTLDINAPYPGETERPDPTEGSVLQLESTARSQSHSLRLGFRQRLSFMNYHASYTLSSAHDDSDGAFLRPMNNYDPGLDWGRSRFNQRHHYTFTVNLQAPLRTLFTVRGVGNSGSPYTITTGVDDNHDQNVNDRPAGVARNSADGPRFFNIDMTLSKTVRVGGHRGSQMSVYANMQNAFNIVNLRNPSGVLTSSYFGIPTAAAPGRDVEVGMRYQF